MSFDFGISATQSALNNWQNNEFQQEANKKERQFQWEMSQYEYENAVEMWNRTNVYNSPAEQRKRLEAAGLNPALMYGKGANPGLASPAPSVDAPDEGNFGRGMGFNTQTNGLQGMLNAYNDLRQTNADIAVKEATARNINIQADSNWYLKELWNPTQNDIDQALNKGAKGKYYDEIRRYYNEGVITYNKKISSQMAANWDRERWKLYDEQGLFLDQMSNAGRVLEREMGRTAAVIFDAIMGKVKSR